MTTADQTITDGNKGGMQKLLDGIEKMGNKVPHPVLMFLYLIIFIIILSHILYLAGVSVTELIAVPAPIDVELDYYEDTTAPGIVAPEETYEPDYTIEERTIAINSLLTVEGIRFIFTSFVTNFQGFGVVAVTFIAIMGAGVAESAGMMSALIRKLVKVAPRRLITFFIVFVGVISSVASDAGYLILIPLGAAAFVSLRRHPLAGMAAAFAGVATAFGANIIFTPIDSMLTEITNEAIGLTSGEPITLAANFFFTFASTFVLAIAATWVTEKIVEPRLGKYDFDSMDADYAESGDGDEFTPEETRGMRYALFATLAVIALVLILTLPPGAPLRSPAGYEGNSPLMDSLLFIITMTFLIAGVAYGKGAGTIKNSNDVINGVTKTFSGLAGLVFMLLMIAQFIAYFNFTNMPTVLAISMAEVLERANIGALPLLLGLILVIVILNIIIPGVVPKWAIFAPVFIPIFFRLGVAPQTVLAAYRVGDSPFNVITPLMVYLPFVVTVAQRYQKESGLGTIVALMLPYSILVLIAWVLFFILWFVLGIPLGPGYPVGA
jgi:aminobenzoyl-glutamate transport protein